MWHCVIWHCLHALFFKMKIFAWLANILAFTNVIKLIIGSHSDVHWVRKEVSNIINMRVRQTSWKSDYRLFAWPGSVVKGYDWQVMIRAVSWLCLTLRDLGASCGRQKCQAIIWYTSHMTCALPYHIYSWGPYRNCSTNQGHSDNLFLVLQIPHISLEN